MSKLLAAPTKNGIQKTLAAQLLSTASTGDPITFSDVDGIANLPGVLVIDRIDANGTATPSKREYIEYSGTSGNTVLITTRNIDGSSSAQTHAVGAIVEFVPDTVWADRIYDALSNIVDPTDISKLASGATLSNASILNPKISLGTGLINSTGATISAILDEDNMVSNSANAIPTQQSVKAYVDIQGNFMPRQALINGNFDVWQRGTSVAGGAATYTADRWLFSTGSGQAHTITQQTAGLNGSTYSCRVQRTAGQLASNNEFYYAMETTDSIKLRGNKLTLSFWAKCGANFSVPSSLLPVAIVTGKGTDQKVASFTTSADAIAENKTLTTSWQKFTLTTTAAIASDITQIGLRFSNYTDGTAGANDWFEITQVQLCAGDVALPFMPKSYEEELRACMRYCKVFSSAGSEGVGFGWANQTTTAKISIPISTMRIIPDLTATAADWQLADSASAGVDLSGIQISTDPVSLSNGILWIQATVASGLTVYRNYALRGDSGGTRILILSSEL